MGAEGDQSRVRTYRPDVVSDLVAASSAKNEHAKVTSDSSNL